MKRRYVSLRVPRNSTFAGNNLRHGCIYFGYMVSEQWIMAEDLPYLSVPLAVLISQRRNLNVGAYNAA